jgi:hypothetical protein
MLSMLANPPHTTHAVVYPSGGATELVVGLLVGILAGMLLMLLLQAIVGGVPGQGRGWWRRGEEPEPGPPPGPKGGDWTDGVSDWLKTIPNPTKWLKDQEKTKKEADSGR